MTKTTLTDNAYNHVSITHREREGIHGGGVPLPRNGNTPYSGKGRMSRLKSVFSVLLSPLSFGRNSRVGGLSVSLTRTLRAITYTVLTVLICFVLWRCLYGTFYLWSREYRAYLRHQTLLSTVIDFESQGREFTPTSVGELIGLANYYSFNGSLETVLHSSIGSFVNQLGHDGRLLTPKLASSQRDGLLSSIFRSRASKRPSVLCTTFMSAKESSFKALLTKIDNTDGICDWAVLMYGGDVAVAKRYKPMFMGRESTARKSRVILFEFGMSRETNILKYGIFPDHVAASHVNDFLREEKYNFKIFPKPLLAVSLIPHLSAYQRVWMFDDDISFNGFQVKKFLLNLECAFPVPPLVAQPLIYENTQAYDFLNYKSWEGTSIVASSSGFIEIQTPILHAGYFEWYLRNVVGRMMLTSYILGADWGFDALFCKTAAMFAKEMSRWLSEQQQQQQEQLQQQQKQQQPPLSAVVGAGEAWFDQVKWMGMGSLSSLQLPWMDASASASGSSSSQQAATKPEEMVACAVIINGSPISHLNSKGLDGTMGSRVKKILNEEMIRHLKLAFPESMSMGHDVENNPLVSPSKFVISRSLVKNCDKR